MGEFTSFSKMAQESMCVASGESFTQFVADATDPDSAFAIQLNAAAAAAKHCLHDATPNERM